MIGFYLSIKSGVAQLLFGWERRGEIRHLNKWRLSWKTVALVYKLSIRCVLSLIYQRLSIYSRQKRSAKCGFGIRNWSGFTMICPVNETLYTLAFIAMVQHLVGRSFFVWEKWFQYPEKYRNDLDCPQSKTPYISDRICPVSETWNVYFRREQVSHNGSAKHYFYSVSWNSTTVL